MQPQEFPQEDEQLEISDSLDEDGRLKDNEEMAELKEVQQEQAQSTFVKLKIVADEKRATYLAQKLLGKTPKAVIKKRKGRGGQEFSYVEAWYVKQMLNALFALQWDFELVPIKDGEMFYMTARQVLVLGKLTIRDIEGNPRIVKMGIGKHDVAYQKDASGKPSAHAMDLGNDIKAAESDALKRCATGVGIALDLYSKED